ncbi:MAG: type II secretion system protein M [Oceanicaulis sp.]
MTPAELIKPARAAWAERTAREQILLAGLAALLAGTVIWFAILGPALSWRASSERVYARAAADYETLVSGLDRYRSAASEAQRAGSSAPLRTIVGASANARGLPISRVQPLEDGGLGVWLDAAQADALLSWLVTLSREEGVMVERVSLDREGDGIVRAQLLLRRPGGGA